MNRRAHSTVVCAVRPREWCNSVSVTQESARSMPRTACRSTVISLAIVILLAALPTNGFTIHRNQEKSETEAADLVVAESTLLEVKNDLNRPNDIKAFKVSKHDGLEKTQTTDSFRNKYTSEEIKPKYKQIDKGEKIQEETIKTVPELTTDYSKGNMQLTTSEYKTTLTAATDSGKSYAGTTKNSEIVATRPGIDITETDSPYTSTQLTSVSTVNNANRNEEAELTTAFIKPNSEGTTVFNQFNLGAEVNTLQDSTTLDDSAFTLEDDSKYNQTLMNKEKTDLKSTQSISEVTSVAIETATNTPVDENVNTFDIDLTTALTTEELTKVIQELSTVLYNNSGIIDLIPLIDVYNVSSEASTAFEFNTRTQESLETKNPTSIGTTEPSWKKYTIIDRKRLTTPEATTHIVKQEVTKAEASPTRISLEEALAVTPIASLERLREDLIANKNKLSTIKEPSTTEKLNISELESSVATPSLKKTEGKVGMVSSMRAGFLDYSGKSSSQDKPTTIENTRETFGKSYDSEVGEIDRLTHRYGNDVESQSQLAEDAMKEELLKEAMLNDNVANARYRDDRAHTDGVEPSLTTDLRTALESLSNLSENKTAAEDALSVQPISQEQGKNLDLYAVSPNYKPMKRIEVQPVKPFVRDPDDNSWRNESISSLGIVFKPKNSSKSFTQVLKNKTENVLSSLADRDSKNGVPDLRERLEKIAEVRKSKKKRINKFGDTVYTDYEESTGSGETFSTPKTETTTVSSSETYSSSNTTTALSSTTERRTPQSTETTEMTRKEKEVSGSIPTPMGDITKLNDSGAGTIRKPSKFYNIAEYYDTTDEYDADYLSLSKIDLKKFTVPFRPQETVVTLPPESIPTKSMPHYPSDRKPTIQYFPPRIVPKVNVHDYDANFNRKVNQYTLKDEPKIPVTTFRTVTSTPVGHKPTLIPHMNPIDINKKLYAPPVHQVPPHLPEHPQEYAVNHGDFNRASYIIKHYGDFINEAAKDDDDRNSDYVMLTEPPIRGITVAELAKLTTGKQATIDDVFDYETQFRKDILNRFVENFNQNSERFKVDFPILYNNSIVHRNIHDNGRGLASSSAFLKRLYNPATTKPNYFLLKKPCEPNCEKVSVELSPAYELHYYVPDQEEKEEADPRATGNYRYRL